MTTKQCTSDFGSPIDILVDDDKSKSFNVLIQHRTRLTIKSIICRAIFKEGERGLEFDTLRSCEIIEDPSEYIKEHEKEFGDDVLLIRVDSTLEHDNPNNRNDKPIHDIYHGVMEFYRL